MKFFVTVENQKALLSLIKKPGSTYVGHTLAKCIPPNVTEFQSKVPFTPSQFESNPIFHTVLNDTLSRFVYESEIQKALATHFESGYLNINDQRTLVNWGRTADPEDILGTVLVKDGKMVPKTFEAMPTHRLYTINGFFKLEPFLSEKLLLQLK
jgi:hypothetical protein